MVTWTRGSSWQSRVIAGKSKQLVRVLFSIFLPINHTMEEPYPDYRKSLVKRSCHRTKLKKVKSFLGPWGAFMIFFSIFSTPWRKEKLNNTINAFDFFYCFCISTIAGKRCSVGPQQSRIYRWFAKLSRYLCLARLGMQEDAGLCTR